MTDKEIMEALRVCSMYAVPKCEICPYYKQEDCVEKSANDAIDLIQRQQEEISALIAGQETLQKHFAEKLDGIVEQLEERIDHHIRLVNYEMNMGTITDVERNRGAIKATEKAIEIVKGA